MTQLLNVEPTLSVLQSLLLLLFVLGFYGKDAFSQAQVDCIIDCVNDVESKLIYVNTAADKDKVSY